MGAGSELGLDSSLSFTEWKPLAQGWSSQHGMAKPARPPLCPASLPAPGTWPGMDYAQGVCLKFRVGQAAADPSVHKKRIVEKGLKECPPQVPSSRREGAEEWS